MAEHRKIFDSSVPAYKAVLSAAIPTILGMVMVLLYNIADAYFVGQTGDPMQVAAVALATPVFLLFMAIGNLIGMGGTSVIARALGAKNERLANQATAFCMYSSFVIGIVCTLVYLVFMPEIMSAIGTDAESLAPTKAYLSYIAPSAAFVIFSTAFGNIIRGEGLAKQAGIAMSVGTVLNIILDPIFILVMDMGVSGAAIATLLGNVAATAYILYLYISRTATLSILPKDFTLKGGVPAQVLAIGAPAAVNNVLMSGSMIVLNNILSSYGQIPVAAMGVAMRVVMIVILLQIGLAAGVAPLLGYAFGANDQKRFKEITKVSILYILAMGFSLTFVCWLAANAIVAGFIDDVQVLEYGGEFVRASLIAGPVIGLLFIYTFSLQAIGAARESLILSLSRQGFVFVPMIIVLNVYFGLKGVIYAQAIADVFSIGIAALLYYPIIKKAFVKMGSNETYELNRTEAAAQ